MKARGGYSVGKFLRRETHLQQIRKKAPITGVKFVENPLTMEKKSG